MPESRRGVPRAPWVLFLAGGVLVAVGLLRVALDSRRDPLVSFVLAAVFVVAGLVLAVKRRSLK